MKLPWMYYVARLGVGVALLTCLSRTVYAVDTPVPQTPVGNGLNNYILLPSAQLAFDDKSRIGAGLTGVGVPPDALHPLVIGQFDTMNIPPKVLLSLAANYTFGSRHLYSTDILLSDNVRSLDIGVQPFFGDSHGYGISLRFDPSREKLAEALRTFYNDRNNAQAFEAARLQTQENAIGDVDKRRLHVRYSAILGFRHINADSEMATGTILDLGAVTSVLIPLNYSALKNNTKLRSSPGINLLLSGQLLQIYPDRDSILNQATLLRYGVGVIWQDQVPSMFTKQSPDSIKIKELIHRWKWQVGVEYLPKNGVDSGRSVNAFVRHRVTPFTEVTLDGGFDGEGVGYAGCGLAMSFDFGRHGNQNTPQNKPK